MFGIGNIFKLVALASIVGTISYGVNRIYEYHLDQIDLAVNQSKLEFTVQQDKAIRDREDELREISRKDREVIEIELKIERDKVSNLKRLLLIDHDLDRLLQRKPGLILPRVNRGTQAYFDSLEEATQ